MITRIIECYKSFEEYCQANPNRDKRWDEILRIEIETKGYLELIEVHFNEKRHKEVPDYIRRLMEAHERTKESTLRFRGLESVAV